MKKLRKLTLLTGAVALSLHTHTASADMAEARRLQEQSQVLQDYRRLLPLEGGSNFRDLGGYRTEEGRTVRRGLLFRSGVMTWLTEADQAYLAQLGVQSVVDLRSSEELELYPNHWVKNAGIDYHNHDYSITALLGEMTAEERAQLEGGASYRFMPYMLKPQLRTYFSVLLEGEGPVVVNCSAGQDRTGIASALLLSALGVPREVIVEDYLLSTDFRRPQVERGSLDLAAHAESNAFAALMASYADREGSHASPLVTREGRPYIAIAFEQIERDFGSVEAFLERELEVDASDVARLRELYLN